MMNSIFINLISFRKLSITLIWILFSFLLFASCSSKSEKIQAQLPQSPSPMEEHIRKHDRIIDTISTGKQIILEDILSKPITLYIPEALENAIQFDILIHFHGAAFVPKHAVNQLHKPIVLAVVNQGSGSSAYEKPFQDTMMFDNLIKKINEETTKITSANRIDKIYCSAFSAGYGAIRALLKSHFERIDGILLLDGLHTDYIPDKTPLAKGGELNTTKLQGFLAFAKQAIEGNKKMLITHSEIFPGTYASLTETTEWLINELHLKRIPILEWGPGGMQQIADSKSGQFQVKTFVGNTAPDHIDHFHGMTEFLNFFWED